MTARNSDEINRLLAKARTELAHLDTRKVELVETIAGLQREQASISQSQEDSARTAELPSVTNQSSQDEKITLFRGLFRGREDVYPRRFESVKSGKSGYQPVCGNEWVSGICEKPKIRCSACRHRPGVLNLRLHLHPSWTPSAAGFDAVEVARVQGSSFINISITLYLFRQKW